MPLGRRHYVDVAVAVLPLAVRNGTLPAFDGVEHPRGHTGAGWAGQAGHVSDDPLAYRGSGAGHRDSQYAQVADYAAGRTDRPARHATYPNGNPLNRDRRSGNRLHNARMPNGFPGQHAALGCGRHANKTRSDPTFQTHSGVRRGYCAVAHAVHGDCNPMMSANSRLRACCGRCLAGRCRGYLVVSRIYRALSVALRSSTCASWLLCH